MRSLFDIVRDLLRGLWVALDERFGDALDVPFEGDDGEWPA